MKTVYLIYVHIPRSIYDHCFKYMISNGLEYQCINDYMVGLYAWTTKKKIIKEFKETRAKKVFEIIEKEYEDDYDDIIKNLKGNYFNLQLKFRPYIKVKENGRDEILIASTLDEYIASVEDSAEWLNEKENEFVLSVPIYLFNDEVYNALDILGLVDINYVRGTNDDMVDYTNFQRSFGITTEGHKIIDKTEDQVNVLLYLFSYLF